MRMPYSELEPEALSDQELQIKDVGRLGLWDVGDIRVDSDGLVGSLRGQEYRSQPEQSLTG